eukprot:scaffold225595_cov19-Prasinocladus_malaysianus.AAC.1
MEHCSISFSDLSISAVHACVLPVLHIKTRLAAMDRLFDFTGRATRTGTSTSRLIFPYFPYSYG